jgi:hypothetical protein
MKHKEYITEEKSSIEHMDELLISLANNNNGKIDARWILTIPLDTMKKLPFLRNYIHSMTPVELVSLYHEICYTDDSDRHANKILDHWLLDTPTHPSIPTKYRTYFMIIERDIQYISNRAWYYLVSNKNALVNQLAMHIRDHPDTGWDAYTYAGMLDRVMPSRFKHHLYNSGDSSARNDVHNAVKRNIAPYVDAILYPQRQESRHSWGYRNRRGPVAQGELDANLNTAAPFQIIDYGDDDET